MPTPLYERIYDLIRQVPPGRVTTYGRVAALAGGCSARMVGYALAALKERPETCEVPWQRVINARGHISPHGFGLGSAIQRQLLEGEGIRFDDGDSVNLEEFVWP